MRVLKTGWERGDEVVHHGWSSVTNTGVVSSTETNQDTAGNGGAGSLRASGTTYTLRSPVFRLGNHRQGYIRTYFRTGVVAGNFAIELLGAGSARFSVTMDGTELTFRIRQNERDSVTTLAQSAAVWVIGSWNRVEIHYFVDDTTGFVRVYLNDDGSYSTPTVQFTGDTTGGLANEVVNQIEMFLQHSGASDATRTFNDDFAVNTPSIAFKTASGSPPADESDTTITGGTSGATASWTRLSTAGSSGSATRPDGRVSVHSVSGTFQDGETITAGGWTATVFAPTGAYVGGLELNSGFSGEGFIIYRAPTGNGNTTQLDGSDGNQVDNYLLVDDNPVDTTTENVTTNTTGQYDTYQKGTLPASAASINSVESVFWASKDGDVINEVDGVLRIGTTDHFTDADQAGILTASAANQQVPWVDNPDTNTQFTPAELNAVGLEVGVRFRA